MSEPSYDIPRIIQPFIGPAIGGLISGFVGIWYARKLDRKRSASAVSSLCFRFLSDLTNCQDFRALHGESIAPFRDAIAALAPFLGAADRQELQTAWTRYSGIRDDTLSKAKESDWRQELSHGFDTAYAKPSEILRQLLDEINRIATKYA